MKKVKIAAAAVAAALAMTSLSACGNNNQQSTGSKSSAPATIEFMTMQSQGTSQLAAIQAVAKDFEAKNPNIKIKILPGSNSNENDIKVRLAGHNPPDMWATHGWSRDRYSNFLEPMQNRPWAKNLRSVGDSIFKDSKGHFYTLPVDIQVSGIMYNKTVLQKAGVDPKGIATWDDFEKACDKIKAAGMTPIVNNAKDAGAPGDLADYILPGMYTQSQLKDLKAGKFDTDTYVKFASLVKKWVDAKYFNVDYSSATNDDTARALASDKAAFYFRSNSKGQLVESYNPNVKLGMMPVPAEVGKPYFSLGEDLAFGVSKTSKHKEQALKFVDFMAEPANMKKLVKTSMNNSALSNVDSALGQFQDTYDYWVTQKKTKTIPLFDRSYMTGIFQMLSKSTDGLLTGQLTPQAAADQVKSAYEAKRSQQS
ncbi:ABC transporter substrate-binding protein [Bifidobacterium sp. ESL0745]|uniref:ABC transporter substrate-binding protein n=1 Tax=Bifidobacterium sp. ESL0745 TaxID=2983226 RepID=UPI0023F91258|nr:ABC transporter substrate-binding protein [Bifidobacterium sp. ESL0745]MDF7665987.1 ABC transporter substrate-binding protein [Bifidobacterium sp. ESL0745]